MKLFVVFILNVVGLSGRLFTSFSEESERLYKCIYVLFVCLFVFPESGVANQINKVISHPTLPVTITANEDRHIRFFDNNTGWLSLVLQ